jgi:hypothetical protein
MSFFPWYAVTALLSGAALPLAAQSGYAFVDVTVIPLDRERVLEHQTVLITDNRVTALGAADRVQVPAGTTTIEGRGKFLIPALGDAHVHLSTPGGTPELAERGLQLLVLNGVAMARSMYTEPHHLLVAARVMEGRLLGPRLQLASPPLSGQSTPTPSSASAAVRQYSTGDYAVIKIMPGLPLESFDSAAAEARRLNRRLAGHIPLQVGLGHALESGYLSIEHLDGLIEALLPPGSPIPAARGGFFGFGLLDAIDESRIREVVGQVKASGVTIVPTETGMEMFVGMDSARALASRPEMRLVPAALVAQWVQQKEGFIRGVGITPERASRYREIRRQLIRELSTAGVPIALGSDGFSLFHLPGFSTLAELELYVSAGLTPYQALRTATVNVARLMGLEPQAGTIVSGGPADLLLLDANPLVDIGAVRRKAGVMVQGQWLSRSELDRRLAALAP